MNDKSVLVPIKEMLKRPRGLLQPSLKPVQIINVTTKESLGPNEDGEICARGPQVMKGYLNRKEATEQTIDAEGWLHTGKGISQKISQKCTSSCQRPLKAHLTWRKGLKLAVVAVSDGWQ